MAFTREFIRKAAKESGVELPKEFEDALVNEHISARDVFAEGKVKTALEENKLEPAPAVKNTQEYKSLKKEYDDYKAGITAKETKAAKEAAAREWYKGKGIIGEALDIAILASGAQIDALELDGEKIKDASALESMVSGKLSRLVGTTVTKGADVAHPATTTGGGALTKADIYKKDDKGRYVMSASERQKALIENQIV